MAEVIDGGGWDLVAKRVLLEIKSRGMSLRGIEAQGGPSYKTLKKFVDGRPVVRQGPMTDLARFFGWRGDAVDLIREGREPVLLEPATPTDEADAGELRFRALERRLDRLEAVIEDALQPEDPQAGER